VSDQVVATVFSALSDGTRLDIVSRLVDGETTLSELAEHYDMSVQAVAKHLAVLEDAGVVSRRREAQRRPVRLEAEVFDLMSRWAARYREQVEARYRRLDTVLTDLDDNDPTHTEATS